MATKGTTKRSAPKVRSGCITCKRRRVKCDEGKPTCTRCFRGGHQCQGYKTPKSWLFEANHPLEIAKPFSLIDCCGNGRSEHGRCKITSPSTAPIEPIDDLRDGVGLELRIDGHCSFKTAEERRSLQFWILKTGPTLTKYGRCGTFFTIVVPQWAQQSEAVRHLLTACAMVHEQLGIDDVDHSTNLSPEVFYHYQLALKDIVAAKHSHSCLIVASVVAWLFEALQSNFSAARIHVEATRKLVREVDSSPSSCSRDLFLLERYIEPCIQVADAYNKAMCTPEHEIDYNSSQTCHAARRSQKIARFKSLCAARVIVSDRILQYRSPEVGAHQATNDQRVFIASWHDSLHQYCRQESESILHKQALHLLANVAVALLPESEVGAFSYIAKPSNIDYVLGRVEQIILEKDKSRQSDRKDIEETLRFVLNHVLCHFQDEGFMHRASGLLRILTEGQAPNSESRSLSFR